MNKTNYQHGSRVYNKHGHRLYFDVSKGTFVPSVTSVLSVQEKPYLDVWKRKMGADGVKIGRETARVGELIHFNCIQHWMKKDENGTMRQEVPRFLSKISTKEILKYQKYVNYGKELFAEFLDVYEDRIRMLDVETLCFSEHGFAGRFDLKFQFEIRRGKWINCIGDIKTSKQIYEDSVSLQLSAYNNALGDWAARLYILRIHPYHTDSSSLLEDPDDLLAIKPSPVVLDPFEKPKQKWEFEKVDDNIEEFLGYRKIYQERFPDFLLDKQGRSFI